MYELLKLTNEKHGALLILLAVILLALYGSHDFAEAERVKAFVIIKENTNAIHVNSEKLHDLDKSISVHIAKESTK